MIILSTMFWPTISNEIKSSIIHLVHLSESRRLNPPRESAFFQVLWCRIMFFPFRLANNTLWWFYRAQLRL